VPQEDTHRVTARAMQLRDGQRAARVPQTPKRDLLGDVLDVLGGEDERASQVARRLRDLPGYNRSMTGSGLVDRLRREFGISQRMLDGNLTIRVQDIRAAIAAREVDDGADEYGPEDV
jgi:hypothetical protein